MTELPNPNALIDAAGFSLFQNSLDYLIVVDREWSVVYANPSFQERFCAGGLPAAGSFLSFLDVPSTLRVRELSETILSEPYQIDVNHLTADGHTVMVHYSFFPLPHTGEGRALVAAVGRDRAGDLGTLLEVIQLNMELSRREKELQEANARLDLLAHTDQITQLYNRHYFFQVAQHFWEEARRYRLPLTVMMMDLDDFKAVNDTHGHLFGDYVLQQAAARLKTKTRKSDILARYGGEEIVVLAPNTDLPTGLVHADRLRLAVGAEPYVLGNVSAIVTISVGISGTELAEFSSFDSLLESSDQALYCAKRAGKNCVVQYLPGSASAPQTAAGSA
jgi:diguanylate cyclase (GGDEF)-like protein/PAS domain S-box-containing protein